MYRLRCKKELWSLFLVGVLAFAVSSCGLSISPPTGFDTPAIKEAQDLVEAKGYMDALRIQATKLRATNVMSINGYADYLRVDDSMTRLWNQYIEFVRADSADTADAAATFNAILGFLDELEIIILKWAPIILAPNGTWTGGLDTQKPAALGGK